MIEFRLGFLELAIVELVEKFCVENLKGKIIWEIEKEVLEDGDHLD